MPKIITINDIQIDTISISPSSVSVIYSFLDDQGVQYKKKSLNILSEQLTIGQKAKLQEILTFVNTKIKQIESI